MLNGSKLYHTNLEAIDNGNCWDSNNNKVMCLSVKLSDKFDPNPMYASDKIVVKHISVKETLLKLDLELKGQGHSKQQNNKQENKNIPPLNKQSRDSLGTCNCWATDESNRL